MRNFMLDIESLDTTSTSVVLQVGVTEFDFENGAAPYQGLRIDVDPRKQAGRTISADTVLWWLSQPKEAQEGLLARKMTHLSDALAQLSAYLPSDNKSYQVWAKGITFDISCLTNAYEGDPPWSFRNISCMRTIWNTFEPEELKAIEAYIPSNPLLHDALADARWQADWVAVAFQVLRGDLQIVPAIHGDHMAGELIVSKNHD